MARVRHALCIMSAAMVASSCTRVAPDLPIAPHLDHDDGVMMQAGLFGRLAIRNGCLVLLALDPDDGDSHVAFTPIWNDDAEVGRDPHGVYVRDRSSGALIRPGDRVTGGGGLLASDPPPSNAGNFDENAPVRGRAWVNRRVSPDLPAGCAGDYATFHSFLVMKPGDPQ